MSFSEIQELLSEHWPALIAAGVILIPIIGFAIHFLYKHRVEELKARIRALNRETDNASSEDQTKASNGTDYGLISSWPKTNIESTKDLKQRIRSAEYRINIFGLTRNFYASDEMRDIILAKSREVPIVLYMMNPDCEERRHRYKIEPVEASFEDKKRYRREIERPFLQMRSNSESITAGSSVPGIGLYYYNFPCSFAVEEIDDIYRIMLYGHGVRGTESPIFIFGSNSPLASYFSNQIRWLERLATRDSYAPWDEKGVEVKSL